MRQTSGRLRGGQSPLTCTPTCVIIAFPWKLSFYLIQGQLLFTSATALLRLTQVCDRGERCVCVCVCGGTNNRTHHPPTGAGRGQVFVPTTHILWRRPPAWWCSDGQTVPWWRPRTGSPASACQSNPPLDSWWPRRSPSFPERAVDHCTPPQTPLQKHRQEAWELVNRLLSNIE